MSARSSSRTPKMWVQGFKTNATNSLLLRSGPATWLVHIPGWLQAR
jgi:hypothetical protein